MPLADNGYYTFTDHRSNIPLHAYQAHDLGLALSTRF